MSRGATAASPEDARPRGAARATLIGGMILIVAAFVALGVWQVHRLAWKTALIARVDARVHAAPVAVPGPADWPGLTAEGAAYRRVATEGAYLPLCATGVEALTEQGAGVWALQPFRTREGVTVFVNRGFVPLDTEGTAPPPGDTRVSGLLRLSEPGGRFLAPNDPAAGRWASRDVAAIAARCALGPVAPYFIDADAGSDPSRYPRGGMTVVAFANHHLAYALTWFGLAALLAGAVARMVISAVRDGRAPPRSG